MNIPVLFPHPRQMALERAEAISASRPMHRNACPTLHSGAYHVKLKKDIIEIFSGDEIGFFYAGKTLHSLLKETPDILGTIEDAPAVAMRIAMIDFKRIGWKIEAALEFLDLMGDLKINYCLLEYEDKFPYSFGSIPSPDAFTPDDIRQIGEAARKNHIELIPLVQTFSHWGYILKHDQYRTLRELPEQISQACPLKEDTFTLFRKMTEEVLAAHPGGCFFHVGADEAYLLGSCPECAKVPREQLYSATLRRAMEWINSHGRTALFWGDFYRTHDHLDGIRDLDCFAVDWSYEEKNMRQERVFFPRIGGRHIGYEDAAKEEQNARFLLPDAESKTLFSFPHQRVMEADGMRVFGAGDIRSPANILAHAETAVAFKRPAVLGTYWASSSSGSMPFTVYPMRLAGLFMLGAAAWNPEYERMHWDSFYTRFCLSRGEPESHAVEYRTLDAMQHHLIRETSAPSMPEKSAATALGKNIRMQEELPELRMLPPLFTEENCMMLDLTQFANSSRKFEVPESNRRYTDETLEFLPHGVKPCCGVYADFPERITLYGHGDLLPHRISIECPGEPAAKVVCLVQSAIGGSADAQGRWGKLSLEYSDGTFAEIVLQNGDTINPWYQICSAQRAGIAVMRRDLSGEKPCVGLHFLPIFNPMPRKRLRSLLLESTSDGVIALAAVTLVKTHAVPVACGELKTQLAGWNHKVAEIERKLRLFFSGYCPAESVEELLKLSTGVLQCKLEILNHFLEVSPGRSDRTALPSETRIPLRLK